MSPLTLVDDRPPVIVLLFFSLLGVYYFGLPFVDPIMTLNRHRHRHHHHKHFYCGVNNLNYCKDYSCSDSSDEWK